MTDKQDRPEPEKPDNQEKRKQKRILKRLIATHEELYQQWTAGSQYASLRAIAAYARETNQEMPAWVGYTILLHDTARKRAYGEAYKEAL